MDGPPESGIFPDRPGPQPEASAMVPLPFPASTTPSITTRDPQWANRTHSLVERTTDADKRITRGLFSLTRPCSKSTPFAPRSYEDRKLTSCATSESAWKGKEPLRNPLRRLRRDSGEQKATGQVHKTEWDEMDGLLTFNGRIYVPDSKDLRQRIIAQYHNSPGRWAPGTHEDAGVDLPGLLVASDRETRWVLHPGRARNVSGTR